MTDSPTPGPDAHLDDVRAGAGGAMTDEVGVITGDLTVATYALMDGRAVVLVQYKDADEWYTLTGNPVPVPPGGVAHLHADVLDRVRAGGGAGVPGGSGEASA
ncbi:hypothetical protein HHL19_36140 [Streptomyces sp. R302]|uniref:hypothetical protein n=1 Tax=unclassified Streptomyces TaxID=2593676 RepID=UPI00145D77DA|nr:MULTISPECIES: hypothetical protein [unclassified Streptomyces]NML55511.1 hypothetical protein [Streptomyces sp. R301]NML83942.1 hypothetical protein [Streptomyces sp. R302]